MNGKSDIKFSKGIETVMAFVELVGKAFTPLGSDENLALLCYGIISPDGFADTRYAERIVPGNYEKALKEMIDAEIIEEKKPVSSGYELTGWGCISYDIVKNISNAVLNIALNPKVKRPPHFTKADFEEFIERAKKFREIQSEMKVKEYLASVRDNRDKYLEDFF